MWPFNKKPAETKGATARLKAFRDVGDTFNYLGRTCVVTAHSHFYPVIGRVPALCFQYADDHGKLHSVVALPYELEAIEAWNTRHNAGNERTPAGGPLD